MPLEWRFSSAHPGVAPRDWIEHMVADEIRVLSRSARSRACRELPGVFDRAAPSVFEDWIDGDTAPGAAASEAAWGLVLVVRSGRLSCLEVWNVGDTPMSEFPRPEIVIVRPRPKT